MKQRMKYSKRLIAAAALIVALGVSAFSINSTLAAESQGRVTTLVEAIAEEFDLKVSDVQAVFDAEREQMESKRESHQDDRLEKAVADGKITREQADRIDAKRNGGWKAHGMRGAQHEQR